MLTVNEGVLGFINANNAFCFIENSSYTRSLLTHGSKCTEYFKMEKAFKDVFQKPQIYASLLFSVIIAVFFGWFRYEGMNANEELRSKLQIIEVIVGITGFSLLPGLYPKGYNGIKSHVIQSHLHSNETSIGVIKRARYLQNLSKTVLLLVLTMLLTYLPICIANGIQAVTKQAKGLPETKGFMLFYTLSYLSMCSNGIFNSMIVLYRNKEAKRWMFQKLLTCGCRKGRHCVQGEKKCQHNIEENGQVAQKPRAGCCEPVA